MSALVLFLVHSICSPLSASRDRYVSYHPETIHNCRAAIVAFSQTTQIDAVAKRHEKKAIQNSQEWIQQNLSPVFVSMLAATYQIYVTQEFNFNVTNKTRLFLKMDGSFGLQINF